MTAEVMRLAVREAPPESIRTLIRTTISAIEHSFNTIDRLQPRTRLALALSLLEKGTPKTKRFERPTAALATELAKLSVDDRHYWIAPAFYVTKTNSNTLDTFRAADQGYLGTFISGVPKFYYEPAKPVGKPVFDVSKLETLPKVTILYSYQDQDAALLDAAVKDGAKGIVIAGTGNGSIPSSLKAKIAELMAKGIPVVRSTRTGSGFVTTEHFGNGGIGAGYFNPQKSRILLMLALAEGAGVEKIRTYFGSSPRDDL